MFLKPTSSSPEHQRGVSRSRWKAGGPERNPGSTRRSTVSKQTECALRGLARTSRSPSPSGETTGRAARPRGARHDARPTDSLARFARAAASIFPKCSDSGPQSTQPGSAHRLLVVAGSSLRPRACPPRPGGIFLSGRPGPMGVVCVRGAAAGAMKKPRQRDPTGFRVRCCLSQAIRRDDGERRRGQQRQGGRRHRGPAPRS